MAVTAITTSPVSATAVSATALNTTAIGTTAINTSSITATPIPASAISASAISAGRARARSSRSNTASTVSRYRSATPRSHDGLAIPSIPREVYELVDLAIVGVCQALPATEPGIRFTASQLAALRAAAAMVAFRVPTSAQPHSLPRGRAANVWQLLATVAPELTEWAALFHHHSAKRAAVVAGTEVASQRDADDALRDCVRFVGVVAAALGISDPRLEDASTWLAVNT